MVRVDDLATAVEDFRAAGFRVQETGGNALIWFDVGPSIELFGTPRRAGLLGRIIDLRYGKGAGRRLVRWSRTAGICDLVLCTEEIDLESAIADLRHAGIPFARPVAFSRTSPDGGTVRFRCGYPRRDVLPFLMTPYDPPQPRGDTDHPNGATGIGAVHVDVAPADRAAFAYLTAAEPRIHRHPAERTAVRGIELAGLGHPPDARLLHGARLQAAGA